MAESRHEATCVFDFLIQGYGAKCHKAAQCLIRVREQWLIFYDCMAEHWKHIRSNPVDSTFNAVRLETTKTKGYLPHNTALKMLLNARKNRCRLDGSSERLTEVIQGAAFKARIK